jgi:pilus assembly protein CpaF
MEGDTVVMQDIFRFEDYGNDENGKVKGEHLPLGVRPKFTPKLEAAGFKLPPEVFMARRNKRRRK